ncbi:MAG: hypothetical protein KC516_03200 [Nanoarchaeota archaeon]|nr:hypothetical protein [Nanoarchaeota archaeon]
MEKCRFYEKFAKETRWLNNNVLECNIGECPYGNLKKLTYEAGDSKIEICKTDGNVIKEDYNPDLTNLDKAVEEFKLSSEERGLENRFISK